MNAASLALRLRKRIATPVQIRALLTHEHQSVQSLGRALDAMHARRFSPAEQVRVTAIEARRAALCASQETVQVEDFGAGGPEDTLTSAAQETGRVVTEVVGQSCRNYSKPPQWAALLFHLIRQFQPGTCLELGTCLGISAAYEGAALAMNGQGRLITMEGSKAFAAIAAQTVAGLGLSSQVRIVAGPFHQTLAETLAELGRVDYAFIDGHHDEQATVQYFEQILPRLGERAVIVFDDIRWSPRMRRAWARVCQHPRVDVAVDLRTVGICLTGIGVKLRRTVVME